MHKPFIHFCLILLSVIITSCDRPQVNIKLNENMVSILSIINHQEYDRYVEAQDLVNESRKILSDIAASTVDVDSHMVALDGAENLLNKYLDKESSPNMKLPNKTLHPTDDQF
jgi:hypothetical protein